MSAVALCAVGWRVVLPPANGKAGAPKPLSQLFVIKTAAEHFLILARKQHEAATLQVVYGLDNAGGA